MLYAHNVGTLNHILKILKVSKNDHERSIIKNAPDGSKDPSGASFLRTFSLFQLQEELDEGQNEKSCGKIACGVQEIEIKARGDPSEHALKGKTREKRVKRRVKHAEQEPVQRANANIRGGGKGGLHAARQQHHHRPQNRPNVKVRCHEGREAAKEQREQHEDVNGDQRLCAIDHGDGSDEHGNEVNVRCPLKEEL